MVTKYIQNTFAGGMIDPTLQARTDMNLRYNSCKTAKNIIFLPTGACANRTGSKFVANSGQEEIILVPFRYSILQQYILEFGVGYIRVLKNDKYILDENEDVFVISTLYSNIQTIKELKFVQSADTLYILHKNYPIQELRRYSDNDWRLLEFSFTNGPFEHINTNDGLKIEICKDTAEYLISNQYFFETDMIGSLFKINYSFESVNLSQSINRASVSLESFVTKGSFDLQTSGGWAGSVVIEKSKDLVNWNVVKKWSSPSTSNPSNINYERQVDDDIIWWYRFRTNSDFSGTIYVSISRSSFDYYFICNIVDLQDIYKNDENKYSRAEIYINNGISALSFNANSVADVEKNIMPVMHSNTDNNIILTKSISYDGSGMETLTENNMYLAFDNNKNTNFEYFVSFVLQQNKNIEIRLTIDCSNNSDFVNGKFVSKIVRADVPIKNAWHDKSSLPKKMKLSFYLNGVIKNVVDKYKVSGLDKEISFTPILCDKVEIIYSDFIYVGNSAGLRVSSISLIGNDSITTNYQNTDWALGAWNNKNGYACCGCFNNDRLVLAGSKKQPYTLWASKTGIYNDFGISDPMEETDAIDINLPSPKRDCPDIYNLINFSKLLVLSSSAESTVDLSNVSQTPQSQRGSSSIAPVVVGNTVLFVGSQGKSLREFSYDMLNDTYSSNDLSFKVKNLLQNRTIIKLAYMQEPSSLVFVLLSDGSMLVLSYMKEENVVAFSTFEMVNAKVEDICALDTGDISVLYLVVNRDNKRFIEKIEPRFVSKDNSGIFLDCCSVFENTDVVSGLDRFNDKEIVCVCDGTILKKVVSQGTISFDKVYEKIVVGLGYESVLELLSAVYEDKRNLQTIVDTKARVCGVSCNWLYSSVDKIGVDLDSLDDVVVDDDSELVSGITTQSLNSYSSYNKGLIYKHSKPFGFCLLEMILKLDIGTD